MFFYLCSDARQAVANRWRLEKVPGDGDCLIWSLLRCLVAAGLLPETVWSNELRRTAVVRSCRQALINHPLDNPLRPRFRDLQTHCVDGTASDVQHDAAYLQFDIHATFVMEYVLTEFEGRHVPKSRMIRSIFSKACSHHLKNFVGGRSMCLEKTEG